MTEYVLKVTEYGQFTCNAIAIFATPDFDDSHEYECPCPDFDTIQEVADWVKENMI